MRPVLARPAALIAGAAISLLLAGCVSLPTSGTVRVGNSRSDGGGLAQSNVIVMDPIPPSPQFTPRQIVRGFLSASGVSAAVAKEYLTPAFAATWHPRRLVRVIDSVPDVNQLPVPSHLTGGRPTDQVTVNSRHLQTLASGGVAEPGRLTLVQGGSPYTFTFDLTKLRKSGWRIYGIRDQSGKPVDTLLLTESDFQRDYLPVNLYFPATTQPALVPSPVYISATAGELGVQQLVNGLTSVRPDRQNWLYRAVKTAFPRDAHLSVQVRGSTAIVDVGGIAAGMDPATLGQMEAQLVWTLTSSPYSASTITGIRAVQLQMKHSSAFLVPDSFSRWAPPRVTGSLYYQTLDPSGQPQLYIAKVVSDGTPGTTVKSRLPLPLLPHDVGRGFFSAIAVSPSPPNSSFSTTLAACRGKKVYVVTLTGGSQPLQPFTLQSPCTSLSWDDKGELWVTAGSGIFVVTEYPTGPQIIPVSIAPGQISTSDTYSSIAVSPDGVRVALIVKSATGSSAYVTAISKVVVKAGVSNKKQKTGTLVYLGQGDQILTVGPDLVDPAALSWYDANHLLVLDRRHGGSQLYEVPLDGDQSTSVPTPPGAISVTSNGTIVAVGTERQGRVSLKVAHGLEGLWRQLSPGSSPVYPG
ncbi:MAG TPA: LpqB family beta-propeller domain-containing protein [Streptosporangiaceae bacterium]|nr:LpqB family beta-propeller domain-containing protein [Streptosporangiaceae bacterium]